MPGLTDEQEQATGHGHGMAEESEQAAVRRSGLTEEQEHAAARRHGPLALSAGAGSGKTSVLVERFVRAVREDGVAPAQILAITFTERAAGELRERIRARLLELRERDAARAAETAFVSTIHGFCARLLRAHPLPAGVGPGFTVIEEGQADRLRRLALSEALAGFLEGEPEEAVELVAAYGAASLEAIVLSTHCALRSQGMSRPRLLLPTVAGDAERNRDGDDPALHTQPTTSDPDARGMRAARMIDDLVYRFDEAYLRRKRERSALDFDDLELRARDLLREHPSVRAAWRERFQMLMVDELQDVNARQLELLELLDRDNLFTVGDELQSIYGFRHAEVRLFTERFERLHREGAALRLTRNFRSRPAILEAVDRVFAGRMGDAYTPLSAAREPHSTQEPAVELLITDRRGWPSPAGEIEGLPQAAPWRIAEARLLAERVAELVQSGAASAGEVGILLRAVGDMPLYEAALRERGLPVLAATGGFWGHQQVSDLLAYLRTLANPLDELALYSTLASPLVGISSDGLVLLSRAARQRGCCAWEAIERHGAELQALLGGGEGQRIGSFGRWLSAERRALGLTPLAQLLRAAIAETGYDLHVLSLRWGERRMANIHKLIRLAHRFEAQEGRDLRAFLDHAAHLSEALAGREADAAAGDGAVDAVQLMSIHAAKGLEFAVVCVADLGRAPRTMAPDLLVDRSGRLGLRLRSLRSAEEPQPTLEYERLQAELAQAQQGEEDRILYVAMTRARERLLLCGALNLDSWPSCGPRGAAPIAWLAPALLGYPPELACENTRLFTHKVSSTLSIRCRINRASTARPSSGRPTNGRSPGERPLAELSGIGGEIAPPTQPDRTPPTEEPDGGWPTVRRLRVGTPEAAPLADLDVPVSYSALAELERCGYRYYLERVLGMKERSIAGRAAEHGAQARIRGTVIHALLETVDFARPRAPSSVEVARAARELGVRISPRERAAICGLLGRALDSELAQRLALGCDARREQQFSFSLSSSEPLLVGVVDLMVAEPERAPRLRGTVSPDPLLIVDYKSDRVGDEEDLEQVVQREYGLQRLLYALAAIHSGAPRVEIAHWFLERPHEPVLVRYGADEREDMADELLERLRHLRQRGFTVAEVPHRGICLSCPGRGTLCSWEEAHTLRQPSPTLEAPAPVATLAV
jgi:ATP-dependent helicase/nuclease subunit A